MPMRVPTRILAPEETGGKGLPSQPAAASVDPDLSHPHGHSRAERIRLSRNVNLGAAVLP
jgi:hypothetical protein